MTQVNQNPQEKVTAWIIEVFNMPQCLTEGLSLHFVHQAIGMLKNDQDWFGLSESDQLNRVQRGLDELEEKGRLLSKMVGVKERNFVDDEKPPILSKRVRVYSLVR